MWLAVWWLVGCDDTVFGAHDAGATDPDAAGWCAVEQMLPSCVGCHSAAAASGGLDLETDPWSAMVGATSAAYGAPIVVAGDPDGSLLIRKIEGNQATDEGGIMPPGGLLDAALLSRVRAWVADGADDTCDAPTPTPTDTGAAGGWCGVQGVLRSNCVVCHSTASALGGLDLETDAHAALVGVVGAYGEVLVSPGDSDASFLITKLEGEQGASGDPMPPGALLDATVVARVRAWIDAGATTECDGSTSTPTGTGRYHPEGWEAPTEHGMAAKFQTEADCRTCHGPALEGDVGPSCTSCHGPGWETTCTFCHGGVDSSTGAPPQDIDDNDDASQSPFVPHTPHLSPGDHADIPCGTCHVVPGSALDAGHLFDDATAGQAEVVFSGIATGGTWNGATCSVYCHGTDGRPGPVVHTAGPLGCDGCHAAMSSPESALEAMSGNHKDHVEEGISCAECHGDMVSPTGVLLQPLRHVDGVPDAQIPITFNGTTCTGNCHGEAHNGRTW